jgi:spermidine/putrescine-binding protein
MLDNLKKILNEDQDPKAIEKITAKLENLLMTHEVVGYIAVQKKPAITVFPDSIVVTNKRIILCKPKNLGLSMEFIDYDWDTIEATFVKEGILGSDFTFTTQSDLTHTVDYLPKNQARKLYTFAKEQLDTLKNSAPVVQTPVAEVIPEIVEEPEVEEVTHYAEMISATAVEMPAVSKESGEKKLSDLSNEELFEKLQNYKKLLDNGLILQGEYDRLKAEILNYL